MKDCVQAWAESGGAPGSRVAYIHHLPRCGPRENRRRRFAYVLLGYATKSRYIHGDGRFPTTDGRRLERSWMARGDTAVKAARIQAENWIRSGV